MSVTSLAEIRFYDVGAIIQNDKIAWTALRSHEHDFRATQAGLFADWLEQDSKLASYLAGALEGQFNHPPYLVKKIT